MTLERWGLERRAPYFPKQNTGHSMPSEQQEVHSVEEIETLGDGGVLGTEHS